MKRSYWKSIVRKKTITVTQALGFCVVGESIGAKCWGPAGNPRGTRKNGRRLRPPGLPRAHASRDGLQRDQTQALGQSTSSFTRQVTQGPRSRLQPRPPLTPARYPTAKTYRLANDGKRLLTNPSSDQNLPVQFCKASSQTKCVIRIHYDIVFGVYAPNSRRMDAGNPAFAGLRNLIGKVNLLSSFQMSEEILASGRRKNL